MGKGTGWSAALAAACWQAADAAALPGEDVLANMSLEELSDVRIVTVSRREQRAADAPAAVFIITAEDLRRTGARSLPEALRLAPNLFVALGGIGGYTITARGFSGNNANKLLVMIDGRSVYTPLFSGVFWDVQDVPMESIERIEVVSGSGGTLWGTNAVNGVINVITKAAASTQGGYAELRWGQLQTGATLRYGGSSAGGAWRVYGMGYNEPSQQSLSGRKLGDARHKAQAGFRSDWRSGADTLQLTGDLYRGVSGAQASAAAPAPLAWTLDGGNVVARWERELAQGAVLSAQAYYDRTHRDQPGSFREHLDIVDVQVQYVLAPLSAHDIAVGAEYRFARDRVDTMANTLLFWPGRASLRWVSLYGQDTITLSPQWKLTAGLRLERNTYTGTETLPSLRLAWKPAPDQLWWAALSRTVRAPSRLDRDLYAFTPRGNLHGGPDFQSETARNLEIGHNRQFGNRVSYSVNLYRSLYDDLRTVTPLTRRDFVIANAMQGASYGIEAWASFQATPDWRLSAGLAAQRSHFSIKPGMQDIGTSTRTSTDPRRTAQLRSSLNLSADQDLDLVLRHVGRLQNSSIPGYTALDLHFSWRLHPRLELSLGASNALDREHVEFPVSSTLQAAGLGRGAYLRLISRF